MPMCLLCDKNFEGKGVLVVTSKELRVRYYPFCSFEHLTLFFVKGHYTNVKELMEFDE